MKLTKIGRNVTFSNKNGQIFFKDYCPLHYVYQNLLQFVFCMQFDINNNKLKKYFCFDYVMNIFSFGKTEFYYKKQQDQGSTEKHFRKFIINYLV